MPVCPDPPAGVAILDTLRTQRPRIAGGREALDRLRGDAATHATVRRWLGPVRQRAINLLDQPAFSPDEQAHTHHHRLFAERCQVLALMAQLEPDDARWPARLAAELDAVAALDNWQPTFVLRTAEISAACAIALDWSAERLPPDTVRAVETALVDKSLRPALETYHLPAGRRYWPDRDNNWNFVCNAGVIMTALAVAEREPELASQALHHAIDSLPAAIASLEPDGGWMEGTHYWRYGLLFLAHALEALELGLGDDFGLSQSPGLSRTGEFFLHLESPAGLAFDFADSTLTPDPAPPLFWLARRFGRLDYAQAETRRIDRLRGDEPFLNGEQLTTLGAPAHVFDLVWRVDVEAEPGDPSSPAPRFRLPLDAGFVAGGVEAGALRASWNDPDASWVAFKAGSGNCPHAHMDLGGFVFDALGQRWACELGKENYSLPGYFERWKGSARRAESYHRSRPEGHNTVVIDPWRNPQQDPDALTRISRMRSRPGEAFAVLDLSAAYAQQAGRVVRGFRLHDQRRRLLVQDEIQAGQPCEVYWFLHTRAAVEPGDDRRSVFLVQGGRRLLIRLLDVDLHPDAAAVDWRFEVTPAEPLPCSPRPPGGQSDNPGVQRLTLHALAVSQAVIAVELVSMPDLSAAPPDPPALQWINLWR